MFELKKASDIKIIKENRPEKSELFVTLTLTGST